MICDSFNEQVISFYCPTNASDETDTVIFFKKLSSLIRHIPKRNILIISWDMNAQIGKSENNKFCFYNLSNRNGEYLADFSLKNKLACLNTKFQKSQRKLWTYTLPNNSKA